MAQLEDFVGGCQKAWLRRWRAWAENYSGGEKQRIAIAVVLLRTADS